MEALAALVYGVLIFTVLSLVIGFVYWVVSCWVHYKVMRMLDYYMAFAAWIPVLSSWALADFVIGDAPSIRVLGVSVPNVVFRLYWLIGYGLLFVPYVGTLLWYVWTGIFRGTCYGWTFSALEGRSYEDCSTVGYIAGFIPIVAVVKFLRA